ncbi:MAG: hypothetical protein QM664_11340, partial [Flavihumibacter sp.]
MVRIFLTTLVFFVLVQCAFAQSPWHYRSYTYAGPLLGARTGFQASCIHGVYRDRQFVGVGAGVDFYRRTSVPLFVTYKLLLFKQSHFYGNINAGTHFLLGESRQAPGNALSKKRPPGFFGEAGIDWFRPLGKSGHGLSVGGFFSYKQFAEKFRTTSAPPGPVRMSRRHRHVRRTG